MATPEYRQDQRSGEAGPTAKIEEKGSGERKGCGPSKGAATAARDAPDSKRRTYA